MIDPVCCQNIAKCARAIRNIPKNGQMIIARQIFITAVDRWNSFDIRQNVAEIDVAQVLIIHRAHDEDRMAIGFYTVPKETDVDRICNALAKDGKVQMPPGPTFFAKRFGGVVDKFGVNWMILVPQAHA